MTANAAATKTALRIESLSYRGEGVRNRTRGHASSPGLTGYRLSGYGILAHSDRARSRVWLTELVREPVSNESLATHPAPARFRVRPRARVGRDLIRAEGATRSHPAKARHSIRSSW